VPAFEGEEPDGDDDLPDGGEDRPPNGGDDAMGAATDNQDRGPHEVNGAERNTAENRGTNPQTANNKYGARVKLPV
jgi:hypothetical protein